MYRCEFPAIHEIVMYNQQVLQDNGQSSSVLR